MAILSLILAVVSFIVFATVTTLYEKRWLSATTLTLSVAFGILFVLFLAKGQPKREIEFPASEYTLEYKIVDYQGQRDTVYVLIQKQSKN